MDKKQAKKLIDDLEGLKKELRYVTSFIGIQYCQCKEREQNEDAGILNRDEEGYFFMSPNFEDELATVRIDFCPFCSKKLFSFKRR